MLIIPINLPRIYFEQLYASYIWQFDINFYHIPVPRLTMFCKFMNKDILHNVKICYNQLLCVCYISMKHEIAYFLQLIEVQHGPTCWLKMNSVISTTKD